MHAGDRSQTSLWNKQKQNKHIHWIGDLHQKFWVLIQICHLLIEFRIVSYPSLAPIPSLIK